MGRHCCTLRLLSVENAHVTYRPDEAFAAAHPPLPCPRPACQELEAALAAAREEAAGLAQEQAAAAARAEAEAAARVAPLQAGGSLAMAVATLPLLQLAYFGLRLLFWLCAGLERLGLF